jgi:hypothetical protein
MAAASRGASASRRGAPPASYRKPISSGDGDGPLRHRDLSAKEARHHADKLPLDTDPDDVAHPQVRSALIDRFSEESERAERPRARRAAGTAGRGLNRGRKALNAAPDSVGAPSWGLKPLSVDDGAGALLGMFVYAALINPWLLGGMPTVKQWWAAKFLNHAAGNTPAASSSSTTSPTSTGAGSSTAAEGSGAAAAGRRVRRLLRKEGKGSGATARQGKSKAKNVAPEVAPPPGVPTWLWNILEGLNP